MRAWNADGLGPFLSRPRKGSTKRVGGIHRRKDHRRSPLRWRVTQDPEAFEGSGLGKLKPSEARDEVASSDSARLLHRREDGIERSEATLDVPDTKACARENAVSTEKQLHLGG
jgi:hypothetical protein